MKRHAAKHRSPVGLRRALISCLGLAALGIAPTTGAAEQGVAAADPYDFLASEPESDTEVAPASTEAEPRQNPAETEGQESAAAPATAAPATEASAEAAPQPADERDLDVIPVATKDASAPAAEKPPPSGRGQLEEIVVTAQKRSSNIQDVPMSVTALSGETLEKLNIFDFKDVQSLAPGLQLDNKDPRAPVATLRGISFDPDSGAAAAVDAYFNEVPMPGFAAFQSLFDIGQIEVLRGPQGTLRGRTSPGGAITVAARRPSFEGAEASLLQSVSTNDMVNTQLAAGAPIIPGALAVRIAGVLDTNAVDNITNVTRDEEQEAESRGFRVVVAGRPTDSLDAVLTYQYLSSRMDIHQAVESRPGSTREPVVDAYERVTLAKGPNEIEFNVRLVTLSLDWETFGGHTLSSLTGYQGGGTKTLRDLDTGNAQHQAESGQTVAFRFPGITQELRLSSPADDSWWSYMLGAYYERAWGETTVVQDAYAAVTNDPDTAPLFGYDQFIFVPYTTRQIAFFGSSRFKFTESDELELGLRKSTYKTYLQAFFTPRNHPNPIFAQIPVLNNIKLIPESEENREVDAFTGSATYTHHFNDDVQTYLAYGRSFRPGGVNIGVPQGTDASLLTFDTESSDTLELGIKTDLFDRRLRTNADIFVQKFKGFLGRSPYIPVDTDRNGQSDGAAAFTYNADAVSRGIEIDLSGVVMENWQASFSASYVKALYDNVAIPCDKRDAAGNPVFTDADGNAEQQIATCRSSGPISNAPKLTFTASSEYVLPLQRFDTFLRGLYQFSGERNIQYVQNGDLDGYGVLNVFLGARSPEQVWEVSLWAKNLLDEEAITSRGNEAVTNSDGTPFGIPGQSQTFHSGYNPVTPIREREIGLSLRYSFQN